VGTIEKMQNFIFKSTNSRRRFSLSNKRADSQMEEVLAVAGTLYKASVIMEITVRALLRPN